MLISTFKKTYTQFYVNCVNLYCDDKLFKIFPSNTPAALKIIPNTKITREGKIAIGFGYYPKSMEEYNTLKNCISLMDAFPPNCKLHGSHDPVTLCPY